jgi:FAD/FMN-containing dehydrogenase
MKAIFDRLADRAGVPARRSASGHPLLVPGDEAGLARALGALVEAGLPPRVDGVDAEAGPGVSLEAFSRLTALHADDGVALVEPGLRWSAFEAALAPTPYESPVFPAAGTDPSLLALAAGRAPFRAFHPFGARAEWIRDLRLVTSEGTVVRSPYAPRRSTGPELRLAALAFGSTWGVPTSLAVRVIPRSPREARVLEAISFDAALAALERLGALGDEASFLAEASLAGKKAQLRLVWRQATLRNPPADLWSAAEPDVAAPRFPGPAVSMRVPWGDGTRAWLASLARARRRSRPSPDVRLWGPDRQGVFVELAGFATVAEAAAADLLPPALVDRVARLSALRERLVERGAP